MATLPLEVRRQAYREAIRRRVCSVCLDSRDDGTCGLGGRVCAIEVHLSRLIDAIVAIESDRMDDYYEAIQAQVCTRCEHEDPAGRCSLRESGDCALYTYLSLVVDAIEEVRQTR